MNNSYTWYQLLEKPFWAPPAWVFGPVWTILYTIIALSFGYVLYLVFKKKLPPITLLPFGFNLLFNLLYTPIQFGLHNLFLATVDIVLVLGTLVWFLRVIYTKVRWVALVNIPYLLWVTFATWLQCAITYLNR